MLKLRQSFVDVVDMLCCTYNLLATVATVTVPRFVSRTAVMPTLFLNPSREATDPPFEFHVLVYSDRPGGRKGNDVVSVLVSVFRMTLLPEPAAYLAIDFTELVTDDTTVPELPEGLLQPPVSAKFLFVEP